MNYYGINELPETYKRYKSYTKDFEKWLMDAASKRGLEIAAQAEAAAKAAAPKANKRGKQVKQHIILSKHILPVAQALADSGIPLEDISGLADLNDAIRARKEVGDWYRLQRMSDEQHPYFISVLDDVKKVFRGWLFTPKSTEGHDDHTRSHGQHPDSSLEAVSIVVDFSNDLEDADQSEDEEDLATNSDTKSTSPQHKGSTKHGTRAFPHLTEPEQDASEDFEVLCFLYDLFHLRLRVQQVWKDWMNGKIGTMVAALVSDLALGVIQQRVLTLSEDVADEENDLKVVHITIKLCELLQEDQRRVPLPSSEDSSFTYPPHLFCVEGIHYLSNYICAENEGTYETLKGASRQKDASYQSFILRFLTHFKLIRNNELRLPVMDKFTESFCSPENGRAAWLAFGFQILLDIQRLLASDLQHVYTNVFDHGVHMSEIMRAHMVYEDEMWDRGNKPDYMSVDDMKFSNVYLPTLERLLGWLKELTCKERAKESGMYTTSFAALHPILVGLTMWHYHQLYHIAAIQKVQFFVVGLAHLYNACQKIGKLQLAWPDLDFIIESQGSARIFLGNPPTDSNLFHRRLCLALWASTQNFANDNRGNWKRTTREAKQKRGLTAYTPLQRKIWDYYNPASSEERWLRLHNLFALLQKDLDQETSKTSNKITTEASGTPAEESTPDSHYALKGKVLIIFKAIAAKRMAGRKNMKMRKKKKVTVPDFSEKCVHDGLLSRAVSQLTDGEPYANFDHLAFFRRACAFFTRVREEVLWDSNKARTTLDSPQERPNDFELLATLFEDLGRSKDTGYKYAGAVEKVKKISVLLQDVIRQGGDAEMKKAEEQLRRRRRHGRPREENPKEESMGEGPIEEEPGPSPSEPSPTKPVEYKVPSLAEFAPLIPLHSTVPQQVQFPPNKPPQSEPPSHHQAPQEPPPPPPPSTSAPRPPKYLKGIFHVFTYRSTRSTRRKHRIAQR